MSRVRLEDIWGKVGRICGHEKRLCKDDKEYEEYLSDKLGTLYGQVRDAEEIIDHYTRVLESTKLQIKVTELELSKKDKQYIYVHHSS